MSQHKQRDVSLTQLRYFVRAAELESMTEAAEVMYMAQSAVSTAIANLETTLGCPLFIRRRSKGLLLTAEGAEFLERAREVLRAVDDAVDAINVSGISGTLVAGCFSTLVPFWLPAIYDGLHSEHPGLALRIRELDAEEIPEALRRRELEAVLTYGFDYGPDITFDRIADAAVYAVFDAEHPLALRDSVTLAELAREPMVLLDMPGSRNYFLSIFQNAGLTPNIAHRFENYEAVRAMVARGHGYSLLNQRPRHDMTYDGLKVAMTSVEGVSTPLPVGIASLAGSTLSRKASAFASQCRRIWETGTP